MYEHFREKVVRAEDRTGKTPWRPKPKSMALSTFQKQPALREIASWMTNTLTSVGDGLLATNCSGQILFMNSPAEQLTGWPLETALHQYSSQVFHLVDEELGLPTPSPLCEAFVEEDIVRSERPAQLITQNGDRVRVDYTAAPIRDEFGKVVGAVIVFREHKPAIQGKSFAVRRSHDLLS